MGSNTKKKEKEIEGRDTLKLQFTILTKLYEIYVKSDIQHVDIDKLMSLAGIEDEKDLMRALFILEGHRLVSPNPPGDFTSRIWGLTQVGKDLVKASPKVAA